MAEALRATGKGKAAPKQAKAKPKSAAKAKRPEPRATSQPSELELRRHKQDILVNLTSRHRGIDTKIDAAMATVDELKGQRKEIRTAIGNSGFRLDLFDEAYSELKLRTSRVDLEAKEVQRDLIREALGLPTGPQDLFKGLPTAARDAQEWEIAGYRAALNGEGPDTEAARVPGPHVQDFMRGFNQVTERNAAGLKKLEAAPKAAALPDGESVARPDWSEWGADHHAWSDEAKALFKLWYDGLDPEILPDVVHAGVKARMEYLDEQGRIDDVAAKLGAKPADDFEASPEELAKQAGRPAPQPESELLH